MIKGNFSFSKSSLDKLNTCHPDLQKLFNEVIKYFDCTIVYGYRSPEEQFELFKQGRELISEQWVVKDSGLVVTNCDGNIIKSNHNIYPSIAVDVIPYPSGYSDKSTSYYFAGIVMGIATELGINVRFGGDWNMDNNLYNQKLFDLPHFELTQE